MRRISSDAAVILTGDVGFRVLNFFATVHLATALGDAGFGIVTVGLSFLAYAQMFADVGIGVLGTREMARPPQARRFRPEEITSAKLVLSALVLPAAVALLFLIYAPALRGVLVLFLINLMPYALFLEWYHQGSRHYVALMLAKLTMGAVYLVGILIAVRSIDDLTWVPILYVAAFSASALLLMLSARKGPSPWPRRFDISSIVRIVRAGGTIGVAAFVGQSVLLLPPIVAERFGSASDAGVLGAALKIVTICLAVDRLFVALFLPKASEHAAVDPEGLRGRLGSTFGVVVLLGCSVSMLISIFARPALEIVYGVSSYSSQGAPVLAIAGWFVTGTLINSFLAYSLVAIGRESEYARANLRSGAVAVALVVTLGWWQGLIGVAAAIVAGELAVITSLYVAFRRHIGIQILGNFFWTVLVAIAVVFAASALQLHSLWWAPVFVAALAIAAAPVYWKSIAARI